MSISHTQNEVRPRLFWSFLGAMVLLDLAITWSSPGADPPMGYSLDHALSIDGFWYMAEARSWIEGRESGVGEAYRRPLVTIPAYLFYKVFGVGIASSRALSSLASVLAILLLGVILRRRFGDVWALAGVLAVVFHPAWHALVRSPVIYPWAAVWLLAALALASGRTWGHWLGGVGVLGLAAWGVKSIVLLGIPAVGIEGIRRMWRTRWGRRGGGALLFAGGLVAVIVLWGPEANPLFWAKLHEYVFQGGTLAERFLGFETRSRFVSALPILVPLAWVGCLLFLTHAIPARGGPRTLDRMAHLTVWSATMGFACSGYTPFRYLVTLFPLVVYLAIAALHDLSALHATRRAKLRRTGFSRRLAAALVGGFGTVSLLLFATSAVDGPSLPFTGLYLAGTGAVILASLALSRQAELNRRFVKFVALVLVPCALLPRLISVLERPDHSLKRAGQELTSIVLPNSRLLGPYAHALTVENQLDACRIGTLHYGDGRLREKLEWLDGTHIVFDRPRDLARFRSVFEQEGVHLEPIETFYIRGKAVVLFHLSIDDGVRSAFEEAVTALNEDLPREAERRLLMVLKGHPRSALAWSQLGRIYLLRDELQNAYVCLLHAIEGDPHRVPAHISLAELYLKHNYPEEALQHLRSALRAEPENLTIQNEVDKLSAWIAQENRRSSRTERP